MIDFYSAKNPNGFKVQILLEELGMDYELHWVDLASNQPRPAEFNKVNPTGSLPAILDREGDYGRPIPVFESGAILLYLAEKSRHFIGTSEFEKAQIMGWLMLQMSALGPNLGSYNYAKTHELPQMRNHFEFEAKRLFLIMNTQLARNPYLAGSAYSIADMATYPWIAAYLKAKPEWFENTPHVRRWAELVGSRPAVLKVVGRG